MVRGNSLNLKQLLLSADKRASERVALASARYACLYEPELVSFFLNVTNF